jgi:hypothetical protein
LERCVAIKDASSFFFLLPSFFMIVAPIKDAHSLSLFLLRIFIRFVATIKGASLFPLLFLRPWSDSGLTSLKGRRMEGPMAYSESLAERIRQRLAGLQGIEEKKMFGGVGFLLNGKGP